MKYIYSIHSGKNLVEVGCFGFGTWQDKVEGHYLVSEIPEEVARAAVRVSEILENFWKHQISHFPFSKALKLSAGKQKGSNRNIPRHQPNMLWNTSVHAPLTMPLTYKLAHNHIVRYKQVYYKYI